MTRPPLPLNVRLKFVEYTQLLERLIQLPTPRKPQLIPPISRQYPLTGLATRTLLLWRLERELTERANIRASVPWPTRNAHPNSPPDPAIPGLLEDASQIWRDYQTHGYVETDLATAALVIAAVELHSNGKPEYLQHALHHNDITDTLQLGRQTLPPTLTHSRVVNLAGHPGAEDARFDDAPLLIHTRNHIDHTDIIRVTAVLLDSLNRGETTPCVHIWFTRYMSFQTYTAEQLLNTDLLTALDLWRDCHKPTFSR